MLWFFDGIYYIFYQYYIQTSIYMLVYLSFIKILLVFYRYYYYLDEEIGLFRFDGQ